MSKTNTFENDWLKQYFNGTAITGVARDEAVPATHRYVSLHTADPGETGSRANECAYTGYAEVAVIRDNTGWAITGNSVSPVSDVDFPTKTAGADEVATHWAVARSAGGIIDYVGTLSPTINCLDGYFPRVRNTSVIVED